jgi:hypothetical protein
VFTVHRGFQGTSNFGNFGTQQLGTLDIAAILRSERDRVARQLEGLNAALAAFAGSYVGKDSGTARGRGRLSAAARARIAAAQRARWAKFKGRKSGTSRNHWCTERKANDVGGG